jgi:hypothetical protein
MSKLVDLALSQRLPRPRRRSQWRRRLAKRLASPRTVLWAAPALALPFLALVLIGEDRSPSPIEQTVNSLPAPAGPSASGDVLASRASPFGAGGRPGVSETVPLYNDSALALAARLRSMGASGSNAPDALLEQLQRLNYAELHPLGGFKDDLLVGPVNGLPATPLSVDLSFKIFMEFCAARPGDPSSSVDVLVSPAERQRLGATEQLAEPSPGGAPCPRLSGDF